jgi:hypothetical protein
MKTKVKLADILLVTLGLIGAVLLWLHIDTKGIVLYLSFLLFGTCRVVDFFVLKHFERNNLKEILKLVTSLLTIVIAGSHILAGGKPLFGILSLMILLLAFSALEPQQNISESEIQ